MSAAKPPIFDRMRATSTDRVPAPCGCLNDIGGKIIFCPLHTAAPDLAGALNTLWVDIQEWRTGGQVNFGKMAKAHDEARAALQKAGVSL